ncbi:hypothetical protein [Neobacillus sp. PS2-9]|uniref:hypothetical protein n=1 Tax=Neobacillus sp. PS2-9 TaxID=3070676 RepID=UPI0027DF3CB0|nr:hypothetical protein [Neobacillus sp. PS2-9]WML57703.1 hypothetical protein RCG25_22825 [Neobacillus sp. PS2-9]
MKKLIAFILRVLGFIGIIVLSIGIFVFLAFIQEALYVPKEYIIWMFRSPYSRLVFIFEVYLFVGYFYLFNKEFRDAWRYGEFFKKYKKIILTAVAAVTIVMLYTVITPVTVVKADKIINYSFFSPQGKEYSYNDIVKIQTGVYGKGRSSLFGHSKGDFFYIIELNDGTRIDLAEVGGTKKDEDERFVIERLDRKFVDMDIPKEASMKNFEFTKKSLAKIYTDKIRKILENTK